MPNAGWLCWHLKSGVRCCRNTSDGSSWLLAVRPGSSVLSAPAPHHTVTFSPGVVHTSRGGGGGGLQQMSSQSSPCGVPCQVTAAT